MRIGKVISTEFDNLKRRIVKFTGQGKSDVQTAKEYSPFGIDSNPVPELVAIYSDTGIKGKSVLIGYLIKDKLAAIGENRLFSLKDDGSLSTFIWLKNDETMQLGGDADFAVRFSKLESEFNKLNNAWNTFAGTYVPGSPTTVGTPATASQSGADISLAKNDKIKTS